MLAKNTKSTCDLKTDLEKALFNEDLCDFTFIINDERIPVSKFILSARSPVFNRMFTSEFQEKYHNTQNLESTFTKEAFKELIRYIYVSEVRELSKHVFELLQASDYYQIESLKKICEEELHRNLSESNASHIFQCVHLYRCSNSLKTASFEKIKRIFAAKSYTIPQSFIDDPLKVERIFEIKNSLEYELRPQVVPVVPENKNIIFNPYDTVPTGMCRFFCIFLLSTKYINVKLIKDF